MMALTNPTSKISHMNMFQENAPPKTSPNLDPKAMIHLHLMNHSVMRPKSLRHKIQTQVWHHPLTMLTYKMHQKILPHRIPDLYLLTLVIHKHLHNGPLRLPK